MASLLQGFKEVQLVKPVGKTVMTVTDSVVRFNKATAEVLNFPAQVKILINDKTRQIAVTPTTAALPTVARPFLIFSPRPNVFFPVSSMPLSASDVSAPIFTKSSNRFIFGFFHLQSAPAYNVGGDLLAGSVILRLRADDVGVLCLHKASAREFRCIFRDRAHTLRRINAKG